VAQFLRPSSDITVDAGWATAPLWSKTNESGSPDGTFITGTGNAQTFEVKLSAGTDPGIDTGHVVRIWARATGSGAGEKLNTWGLYDSATPIITKNETIARGSFNEYSLTPSEAQVANINDYGNLRVRGLTSQGAAETIDIDKIELEIPNAPSVPDDLTATDITTGSPGLDVATIGQTHALGSSAITVDAPMLATAAIGQVHTLTSSDVIVSNPTVDAPTLQEASNQDDLVASGIATGAASIGNPAIGQTHALSSAALIVGSPVLDVSVIGQIHSLVAGSITTGATLIANPGIGQIHVLATAGLLTDTPTVGAPSVDGEEYEGGIYVAPKFGKWWSKFRL